MGTIREVATGKTAPLEWEHFIGRAMPPRCALTLDRPHVSGVHAVLRCSGSSWDVKDLGSRNGTYVDGHRLESGGVKLVRAGSKIGFGRIDDLWQLVEDSAPPIMAVPLHGGDPLPLQSELIGLPSNREPIETIYRETDGRWILERANQERLVLSNGITFESVDRLWRFSCPGTAVATVATLGVEEEILDVTNVKLTFSVSREEEFVHLIAACGNKVVDLGSSVYNFLLLTLARQRLSDVAEGLPETSCGWIDPELLAHDPMMATPQLNLAVYRIRQQFARTGAPNAAMIIERRPHQLRIGTPHITIIAL
jgi:hypothetical protein